MTIAGVWLGKNGKPFDLSGFGATVVVNELYAVGTWLAFLTDVGLFLIPGHVLLMVHAVGWGALLHRESRARYERYESYLRRTNGQGQGRQWAVDGRTPALAVSRSDPLRATTPSTQVDSVRRSSPHTG